ncbi:hypothetical protein JW964_02735 [candidate division KSB1 bacterium]|nr:hypothetical protein [candidate division KSB1 bacterium]
MRIGEVIVFGTSLLESENFIRAICEKVEKKDDLLCFGRLTINEQLQLHLYGISQITELDKIAWNLITPKVLGCILIFNWYQYDELKQILILLDNLYEKVALPLIIAGNVKDKPYPVSEPLFQGGIALNSNEKLIFYRVDDLKSCQNALISLIDIVSEKVM